MTDSSAALLIETIEALDAEQYETLIEALSEQGLADDAVALDGNADETTLSAIAEVVWDCLGGDK